jgi:subtilisin
MSEERKPVIVTFKTKAEPEIVLESSETAGLGFTYATTMNVGDLTPDIPSEEIGLVIDMAKSVTANLTDSVIEELRKNPEVEMAEYDEPMYAYNDNYYKEPIPFERPELIPRPWPIRCGYTDKIPWGIDRIDAERSWDITQGKGIKVAVADTGIDNRHPDLYPNFKGGASFVPGETSTMDYNRHGTHVSGTIAAARNCRGVVGVAPSSYLYAVKVLNARGSGQFSYLIAGLEWCIKYKMDVVNMSLGGPRAPTAVGMMCDLAYKKGILLVGNSRLSN